MNFSKTNTVRKFAITSPNDIDKQQTTGYTQSNVVRPRARSPRNNSRRGGGGNKNIRSRRLLECQSTYRRSRPN